ncbi:MAG TPA: cytochrome c3 family protein, partial [Anaeromyxobacter sp.]|nr:cytochrome c3 family protein [Anaeromyxobacter sp.]
QKVNVLCTGCHPAEADGKHVTTVSGGGHPVGGNLNDPRRQGRDFSCASCHDPHGSDNPRFFYFGTTTMGSCDGCHGDKSGDHPELKDLIPKSKRRAATPSTTGTGAPGSGAPGAGAGAGGAGSGAGSGGGVPAEGLGGNTR